MWWVRGTVVTQAETALIDRGSNTRFTYIQLTHVVRVCRSCSSSTLSSDDNVTTDRHDKGGSPSVADKISRHGTLLVGALLLPPAVTNEVIDLPAASTPWQHECMQDITSKS